ncbi:DUF4240 domain-containing protein [Isoptericola sp. QY 916]
MSVDEFWELVSVTGGQVDDDALRPLRDALGCLSPGRMTAFGDHFRAALKALYTPAHLEQPVRDVDGPPGAVLPMSDDVFLYMRCAVVGAGRQAWKRVVADPAALAARPWQMADGELLLALVEDAYDDRTGEVFELDPSGDVSADWLEIGCGLDIKVPDPAAGRWADLTFTDALNADAGWRSWWDRSGRDKLRLYPFVTPQPSGAARVRRRRRSIDVEIELGSAWRHGHHPQQLADAAVREIQDLVEFAAAQARLPAHPDWPAIGPVPDDLSDYGSVGDDVTQADLREAFLAMGLSPGQADELLAASDVGEGRA